MLGEEAERSARNVAGAALLPACPGVRGWQPGCQPRLGAHQPAGRPQGNSTLRGSLQPQPLNKTGILLAMRVQRKEEVMAQLTSLEYRLMRMHAIDA